MSKLLDKIKSGEHISSEEVKKDIEGLKPIYKENERKNMKYDYTKLYNEHWAEFMDESKIDCIGIIRKDKEGNSIWGFTNVFADDQSPYDFCARLGLQILRELNSGNVESLNITAGYYMLNF